MHGWPLVWRRLDQRHQRLILLPCRGLVAALSSFGKRDSGVDTQCQRPLFAVHAVVHAPIFACCRDVQIQASAIAVFVARGFAGELGAVHYEGVIECHGAAMLV